jgi:hypothetical protein
VTNFAELDATIDYAVDHPEEFDMSTWGTIRTCGTTACLAGTVAIRNGYRLAESGVPYSISAGQRNNGVVQILDSAVSPDGEERAAIIDVGQKLLGIDVEQAEEMFYAPDIVAIISYRNYYAYVEDGPQPRTWKVPVSMVRNGFVLHRHSTDWERVVIAEDQATHIVTDGDTYELV